MPSISILIPTLQERGFIRSCLESVLSFQLPPATTIEILVLDGMSTDGTRDIVNELAVSDSRIQLVDNQRRFQSAALNLGVRAARGDYIMRLDAHSSYPPSYLAVAIETAERTGCDNAGGVVKTMSRGTSYGARMVQALITHKFGVGNSGFRTSLSEGPADTVPYGFFRRQIFDKVGLFDERLVRAQDYEMNRRILASGGTIWKNPRMEIEYFPPPDFGSFIAKQFAREAPYNVYLWYLAPYAFAARHAITGLFAAGVLLGIALSPFSVFIRTAFAAVMALYVVLAIISAVQQSIRYREPRHALFLPPGFFVYHFFHGLGMLFGAARLITGTAPVQRFAEPWPGAGKFRAWPPGGQGS